jgi:hypothetical protein
MVRRGQSDRKQEQGKKKLLYGGVYSRSARKKWLEPVARSARFDYEATNT